VKEGYFILLGVTFFNSFLYKILYTIVFFLNFLKFVVHHYIGKGQGTPMLRDGIHCIGVDADDAESELSDWQGFE
jgi:hypothetical protein